MEQLRHEFQDLTHVVELLAFQIQRQNDNMEHARTEILQEVELRALRVKLGLPPANAEEQGLQGTSC